MHSPQIGQHQKKVESYLFYRDFQISGDLGVEVRTPTRELHEEFVLNPTKTGIFYNRILRVCNYPQLGSQKRSN